MGLRARRARLRAELAELGVDANATLRWRAFVLAVAALEPRGRERRGYLSSDGGPGSDTLMAWASPPPRSRTAWIADAVARARAARAAVAALDGELPGQPLAVRLVTGSGVRATPCALDHAAFAIGEAVAVAPLDATDPVLHAALSALWDGRLMAPLLPLADAPPAFVAVSVGVEPLAAARHGHRRAWTTAGGPWLGLGHTATHALASTTHFVVDGYGHAWLCARLAAAAGTVAIDDDARQASSALPAATPAEPSPLRVAIRVLPPARTGAAALAHALAAALPCGRAGWSPTIQVPVPVAPPDAVDRRCHRVVPALVALRHGPDGPEPLAAFRMRLRAAALREGAGAGLISRVLAAARGLPVPMALRRGVAGAAVRPAWLAPFTELLAGRGGLSLLRLPDELAAPGLVAISAPAIGASPADPAGSCLATVVATGAAATLTVVATGAVVDEEALADALAAVWTG